MAGNNIDKKDEKMCEYCDNKDGAYHNCPYHDRQLGQWREDGFLTSEGLIIPHQQPEKSKSEMKREKTCIYCDNKYDTYHNCPYHDKQFGQWREDGFFTSKGSIIPHQQAEKSKSEMKIEKKGKDILNEAKARQIDVQSEIMKMEAEMKRDLQEKGSEIKLDSCAIKEYGETYGKISRAKINEDKEAIEIREQYRSTKRAEGREKEREMELKDAEHKVKLQEQEIKLRDKVMDAEINESKLASKKAESLLDEMKKQDKVKMDTLVHEYNQREELESQIFTEVYDKIKDDGCNEASLIKIHSESEKLVEDQKVAYAFSKYEQQKSRMEKIMELNKGCENAKYNGNRAIEKLELEKLKQDFILEKTELEAKQKIREVELLKKLNEQKFKEDVEVSKKLIEYQDKNISLINQYENKPQQVKLRDDVKSTFNWMKFWEK